MSVNLSALQIQDLNLSEKVRHILALTEINPKNLKLEVTETAYIENLELATRQLEYLKQEKIQICVDDFGTGYSSIAYLKNFPVDILKIDRSFISEMNPENHDSKMVQGIISLAHALDIAVIAEGIETSYQEQQLKVLGCQFGQGYWFTKPLKVANATEFIRLF